MSDLEREREREEDTKDLMSRGDVPRERERFPPLLLSFSALQQALISHYSENVSTSIFDRYDYDRREFKYMQYMLHHISLSSLFHLLPSHSSSTFHLPIFFSPSTVINHDTSTFSDTSSSSLRRPCFRDTPVVLSHSSRPNKKKKFQKKG